MTPSDVSLVKATAITFNILENKATEFQLCVNRVERQSEMRLMMRDFYKLSGRNKDSHSLISPEDSVRSKMSQERKGSMRRNVE